MIFLVFNGIALFANVSDFIYFRFNLKRSTAKLFTEFGGNDNMLELWIQFFMDYWHAVLFWLILLAVMGWAYKKLPISQSGRNTKPLVFYPLSVLLLLGFVYLAIGGIRGGFKHSTRPITLSNALAYVDQPREASIVLNTPFSIIRTLGKTALKEQDFFTAAQIEQVYTPIHKADTSKTFQKKNVVVFILESFAKEYSGYFNPKAKGGTYQGYTPFLDSLAQNGLTFWHSFANGGKSIDAMPSVLASIPSIQTPYVLSHYANNDIEGLGNLLGKEGYQTAFFHGAPNGSMGFDAFANLAGYQSYFGKEEYNNDEDYDGIWGIWDHKFFEFYAKEISKMQEPFHTALFSVSSHHPFKVPQKFEGKYPQGDLPIHQCVGYTDHALRNFFEMAKQQPWYENTLFVITADHTNQTALEGYASSMGRAKVPIVFYAPADSSLVGTSDSTIAQQMDVMPTVLGYLGYNKPYFAYGTNLLNTQTPHFAVNYYDQAYHLYQNDWLIQSIDGKTASAVYQFKEDPLLQNNLLANPATAISQQTDFLKGFIQQYNNRLIHNNMTATKSSH